MQASIPAALAAAAVVFAPPASAQVNVGPFDLPAGAEVTLEVDVLVLGALNDQATDWQLCTQGTVSGTGFTDVSTDDPTTGAAGDPTCTSLADFGDAPSTLSYPQDARHNTASGLRLGTALDADGAAQGTATSDGDDLDGVDDDDGVVFGTVAQSSSVSIDVTVNGCATTCTLNAWLDWNGDGDWGDAGEQIFADQSVTNGTNNLSTMAPTPIFIGTTATRFRLSTQTGLAAGGSAPDGEVEDYEVATQVPVQLQGFEVE